MEAKSKSKPSKAYHVIYRLSDHSGEHGESGCHVILIIKYMVTYNASIFLTIESLKYENWKKLNYQLYMSNLV